MRRYARHRLRLYQRARVARERRLELALLLGVTVETLEAAMQMLLERNWRERAARVAARMREEG